MKGDKGRGGSQGINQALEDLKIKSRIESSVIIVGPVRILSIKEPAPGNPIELVIGKYERQEKIDPEAPKPMDVNDF
jgi:hypothetical protein